MCEDQSKQQTHRNPWDQPAQARVATSGCARKLFEVFCGIAYSELEVREGINFLLSTTDLSVGRLSQTVQKPGKASVRARGSSGCARDPNVELPRDM